MLGGALPQRFFRPLWRVRDVACPDVETLAVSATGFMRSAGTVRLLVEPGLTQRVVYDGNPNVNLLPDHFRYLVPPPGQFAHILPALRPIVRHALMLPGSGAARPDRNDRALSYLDQPVLRR